MEESTLARDLLKPTFLTAIVFGACVLIFVYIIKIFKNNKEETPTINEDSNTQLEKKKEPVATSKSKKKALLENRWTGRNDKQSFSHPWLLTSLKGHTGQVLDMDISSNEKYLASCGDDRTVFLWDIKDFKQREHRSLRVNIEFDYPTFVKWSPDSKAFIINRFQDNAVEVYKVEKKKDGSLSQASQAFAFPKVHEEDVIGVAIASNGKFIMTCSKKTDLVIWDLKGQQLAQIDTCLMTTSCAKISPCGKFITASGFSPDAKVWEVIFSKTGEFQEVKRCFELSGHTSGIYDVAFNPDSSQMATVSKDGTWKLFDINVEYKKGEDPHLKLTGKYKTAGSKALIALSQNFVVAIAVSNTLYLFSTLTSQLDRTIENVYGSEITSILFNSTGEYLLTAGDRHVRVFNNVTGRKCVIQSSKEKLKENQTSATKERLQKIIDENQKFIDSISSK